MYMYIRVCVVTILPMGSWGTAWFMPVAWMSLAREGEAGLSQAGVNCCVGALQILLWEH